MKLLKLKQVKQLKMKKIKLYKNRNLINLTINQLFKVRLHLGHKNNKLNLKMLAFMQGTRHDINIFNLEKILISLRLSFRAISEIAKQRGYFFLIGTNKNLPMNEFFYYYLNKYSMDKENESNFFIRGFVGLKWIEGLFSNWRGTLEFIKYIEQSPKKNSTRYTKYSEALQGINKTKHHALPDIVFSFNGDLVALEEIQSLNIPIIGINDSNINPDNFLYNLIGNDDSLESVQFFCNFLEKAIKEGKTLDQERFFMFCLKTLGVKLKKLKQTKQFKRVKKSRQKKKNE